MSRQKNSILPKPRTKYISLGFLPNYSKIMYYCLFVFLPASVRGCRYFFMLYNCTKTWYNIPMKMLFGGIYYAVYLMERQRVQGLPD